jgi:hypothetical protein
MKAFDVELSCKPHMVCGSFCNANIDSNFGVFWCMQVTLVMAYLNGNDIPDFFQLRTLITKAGFSTLIIPITPVYQFTINVEYCVLGL